ncbi:hypothetical protein SY83_10305 [Paenibacillus swuensis]|uniref:HTH araC/xylS-type domain-containing protein n=1 Tax=Paenibacillus swuensis TaxID=1178515 RepID=A0A172THV8_9BACL|nr:AraC family transcriptional regulator [Paenibacillus swuensis]ANE46600.1 hypothetical protein SY83_10305 [Paenibacillus swuensis]
MIVNQYMLENSTEMRFNYENASFPVYIAPIDTAWNVKHVLHWHTNIELVYQVRGYNVIYTASGTLRLYEGQVAVLHPGELHCHSVEDANGYFYVISLDLRILITGEVEAPHNRFIQSLLEHRLRLHTLLTGEERWEQEVMAELRSMIELYTARPKEWEFLLASGMYRALSLFLNNGKTKPSKGRPIHKSEVKMRQLRQAIGYIHDHYDRELSIQDIAEFISMNPFQLIRLFRSCTGKTPIEYLHSCRVREAVRLLQTTDKKIMQVAMDTGFGNLSYFNAVFRKYTQCTPTVMRNSYRTLEPRTLPQGWVSADIGSGGAEGSASSMNQAYYVNGGGFDIGGERDAFHYCYTKWTGDFTVSCRIVCIVRTHIWAKAGIMIRDSLRDDGKFIHMYATPHSTLGLAWRPRAGADCEKLRTYHHVNCLDTPVFVKLERRGGRFTAAYSMDGVNWLPFPHASAELKLPDHVYIGFAVSSHDRQRVCSAKFDQMRMY